MTYQTVIPNQLGQAAITGSVATIYTTPANARTFVKDINICNTTNATITVNLYFVPSGGTAGTSNAFYYGQSVAANSTLHWVGSQILLSSQTIQVSASTTGCTIVVGGGEAT
jgi:hypothetical protein